MDLLPSRQYRSAGKINAGAQRNSVTEFLSGGNWKLVKEFGRKRQADGSPMLDEAIKACRACGAKLVIAKLDRLSRDHFLLGLEKASVDFVAAE
ncbi:recombinase family protein [Bradyrhizobium nanningense]|uniref:recombinase family protein n=1 Tax=Bradyrhizobium nanningense TaxID=1325118 RepID=UPI003221D2B2